MEHRDLKFQFQNPVELSLGAVIAAPGKADCPLSRQRREIVRLPLQHELKFLSCADQVTAAEEKAT